MMDNRTDADLLCALLGDRARAVGLLKRFGGLRGLFD